MLVTSCYEVKNNNLRLKIEYSIELLTFLDLFAVHEFFTCCKSLFLFWKKWQKRSKQVFAFKMKVEITRTIKK